MSAIDQIPAAVDAGLFVLIWIVQLIIYPSFRRISSESFVSWHASYSRAIGWIVMPLMLLQIYLAIRDLFFGIEWHVLLYGRLSLVVITWLATFCLFVPLHSRLQKEGKSEIVIQRIISANWIRTICWTALLGTRFVGS